MAEHEHNRLMCSLSLKKLKCTRDIRAKDDVTVIVLSLRHCLSSSFQQKKPLLFIIGYIISQFGGCKTASSVYPRLSFLLFAVFALLFVVFCRYGSFKLVHLSLDLSLVLSPPSSPPCMSLLSRPFCIFIPYLLCPLLFLPFPSFSCSLF